MCTPPHSRMMEHPMYMWGCMDLYKEKIWKPRD